MIIFDKLGNLDIAKTKIAYYLRLIINMGLIESISNELPNKIDMEESITTKIVMKYFIEEVDKVLDDRQRSIIHEIYKLDNDKSQILENVGHHHGVNREMLRQIETKAIRKLRINENIRKYKGENI